MISVHAVVVVIAVVSTACLADEWRRWEEVAVQNLVVTDKVEKAVDEGFELVAVLGKPLRDEEDAVNPGVAILVIIDIGTRDVDGEGHPLGPLGWRHGSHNARVGVNEEVAARLVRADHLAAQEREVVHPPLVVGARVSGSEGKAGRC